MFSVTALAFAISKKRLAQRKMQLAVKTAVQMIESPHSRQVPVASFVLDMLKKTTLAYRSPEDRVLLIKKKWAALPKSRKEAYLKNPLRGILTE